MRWVRIPSLSVSSCLVLAKEQACCGENHRYLISRSSLYPARHRTSPSKPKASASLASTNSCSLANFGIWKFGRACTTAISPISNGLVVPTLLPLQNLSSSLLVMNTLLLGLLTGIIVLRTALSSRYFKSAHNLCSFGGVCCQARGFGSEEVPRVTVDTKPCRRRILRMARFCTVCWTAIRLCRTRNAW